MNRRNHAVSLQQATQDSPVLARLTELSQESLDRLKAVEPMIPAVLRASVIAGPIEGQNWCLIVNGNAAAAKIRQLLPTLLAQLRTKGWQVNAIRVKVQIPQAFR